MSDPIENYIVPEAFEAQDKDEDIPVGNPDKKWPDIAWAFNTLKDAILTDDEYAWTWLCNVSMNVHDSLPQHLLHKWRHWTGNVAGFRIMEATFGKDMHKTSQGRDWLAGFYKQQPAFVDEQIKIMYDELPDVLKEIPEYRRNFFSRWQGKSYEPVIDGRHIR